MAGAVDSEIAAWLAAYPAPDIDYRDVAAVRAGLGGSGALVIDLKAEADRLYRGYFERALAMSAVGLAGHGHRYPVTDICLRRK